MLSGDVVDALIASAIDAADRHDRRSAYLKRQVFAAVDELKASGMSPEQIIVVLRTLLKSATTSHYPISDDLAVWCAERYFASDGREPAH